MAAPWFHLPHVPQAGGVAHLPAAETRHALSVRRLGAGDAVVLFDGQGAVAQATLQGAARKDSEVSAQVHAVEHVPPLAPPVWVAVAPPKGDRWSTMADMLAQLSVAQVLPLVTEFGVRDAERVNRARTERIFLEACKQCRCAWLPALGEPVTPAAAAARAVQAGGVAVVCHPGGRPVHELAREAHVAHAAHTAGEAHEARAARDPRVAGDRTARVGGAGPVVILIGPEGGLSDAEVAAAEDAGALRASLGPTLLRVELAAVASVCAFRQAADAQQ